MKMINAIAGLRKINKPFVKSIKSPDGDVIDCVLFHLQPAFDIPELRETMSQTLPELPKGDNNAGNNLEIKQLWNSKGVSCPNGTIPIRRTRASDVLRIISISKFRKKFGRKDIPAAPDHEHAIGYVKDVYYYGAKALLNVWKPNVTGSYSFSLSQIWVVADVPSHLVNTIEAGWQVYPAIYNDNLPRIFTYWTPDGYRSGCYNLMCSGFVQTSHKVSLGAAIYPISSYNGQQYDVSFMIWKDVKSTNWWLKIGNEVIGYWPKTLFSDLREHATSIEYGGEVYSEKTGKHPSTQMGSGHFPDEGLGKAAYARNLEVVDELNNLGSAYGLRVLADKPNCYGVNNGYNDAWGNYIYFGGPGYNSKCL
ncbi:hypothetical protein E3N88_32010 [Mikania micrantha]|uniref:Neprosin PEP catalytic domain-containing protein n=1 Tax=Mikania micrantha TaxID=192012 RepID=A0A5N6M8G3_9ASTR|nr:hypothetical protein E3N88_32010 [Mikania micrantha]